MTVWQYKLIPSLSKWTVFIPVVFVMKNEEIFSHIVNTGDKWVEIDLRGLEGRPPPPVRLNKRRVFNKKIYLGIVKWLYGNFHEKKLNGRSDSQLIKQHTLSAI